MNKLLPLIFILQITGCGSKFDDEVTDITKCSTSAKILGGAYERNMQDAYEWKAARVKMVEFDMDRLKYYQKITKEIANSDGTPDLDKVLAWYNSKYCKNMMADYEDLKK